MCGSWFDEFLFEPPSPVDLGYIGSCRSAWRPLAVKCDRVSSVLDDLMKDARAVHICRRLAFLPENCGLRNLVDLNVCV